MTEVSAQGLKKLIEKEISGVDEVANFYGINLQHSLVEPYRMKAITFQIKDGKRVEALEDVWVVLEEHPGERTGYFIFYDEELAKFGLIYRGGAKPYPAILGVHGSFLEH